MSREATRTSSHDVTDGSLYTSLTKMHDNEDVSVHIMPLGSRCLMSWMTTLSSAAMEVRFHQAERRLLRLCKRPTHIGWHLSVSHCPVSSHLHTRR